MDLWTVAFTIYTTCCIHSVTSLQDTVFSISFLSGGSMDHFYFSETMFNRFYHCLRNKDHTWCGAQRNNEYEVVTVKTCPAVSSSQRTDQFTCKSVINGFVCKGINFPSDGDDSQCTALYNIHDGVSLSQEVRLTWDGVSSVTMDRPNGIVISLNGRMFTISGTFVSKVTTALTTTTQRTRRTHGPSQPSTTFSITTSMEGSAGADKQKSDDKNDNNVAIIIGAAVGGTVIVFIIAIIVIVLWRRKRRPSSSSTANDKAYEDTDIYPYGDSNLNNTEPNRNQSNLNTNSTPITYSTVDPDKKLNKTQISSDTNNANKLQPKKPRFNQNLDYTDVDIDNDADHYQSTPDVHDGQGVANRVTISPSAPPFPSAKPSSYSISSKTVENPSERYSQVVKTNKTKDASAINGDGTGSNPTRDPSGYEEARPHIIDTQYATVDPSANNAPTSAPDGVYAKLHDPVRNITDVYNEWPATN